MMKHRHYCAGACSGKFTLGLAALLAAAVCGCTPGQAELNGLPAEIDGDLARQCCEAVARDAEPVIRAQVSGIWAGPAPWYAKDPWSVPEWVPPRILVDMRSGGPCGLAGRFLGLYEAVGDRRYLAVALKTCDFLVAAEEPEGYWLPAYVVTPEGALVPVDHPLWIGKRRCRIQDGYQNVPFALMLNAYRLTGEKRYLAAARRSGDCVLGLQLDCGGWPDYWEFGLARDAKPVSSFLGTRLGPSWNDGATTLGLQMMFAMYHLTGETKYLRGTNRLGQWLIDSQIGQGKVRGWADQYGPDLKPIPARSFEGTQIEPRVVNRFIGPLLAWYYELTGDPRYLQLLRETYDWMRSVEQPDGWAAEYTPDGRPCWTEKYKLCLYEDPATWLAGRTSHPGFSRRKVNLSGVKRLLDVIDTEGRGGLRRQAAGPTKFSREAYAAARVAAARRAVDPQRVAAVRAELAKVRAAAPALPADVWRYAPPRQLVEFVRDVRIARGEISADALARGGTWPGGGGGWLTQAWKVTDWFDVPLPKRE
jgi:hypothetical protein